MTLNEKAAYIKGLAEGIEIDEKTKEGKIILALLDLVSDMAQTVSDMEEDIEYLNEYIEEIDEDLGDVEECLADCDCDEDDFDEECDGDCDSCEYDCADDDEYFEIDCPACGETICFDESIDPEDLVCPACGEKFECIVSEDDLKTIDGIEE
ncbi:MAG: hypothetical protein IJ038_00400 [Clostridia bacterium]|nr:hypothetical protein [Clostridia bacterium]